MPEFIVYDRDDPRFNEEDADYFYQLIDQWINDRLVGDTPEPIQENLSSRRVFLEFFLWSLAGFILVGGIHLIHSQ